MASQKSLRDLVSGIRGKKGNEAKYANDQIADARKEAKSADMRTKVVAIQKLTYMYMLGYDMAWASFNVVEVMSSPKLSLKRVGYLAATQTFNEDTEVMLLIANLLKKDMSSENQFDIALALDCLANIVTEELANVLVNDVYGLLNHFSAYIRKKSVLVLYKMFLRYPDALRPSFKRLQEKLADEDTGVVMATVTVMTELAMRNPKNYLPLAPMFYRLLHEGNQSNWVMIKLVKLFGILAPHEPRLVKKLGPTMQHLLNTTSAKSLLYECLHTISTGLYNNSDLVVGVGERVREFVGSPDQNLKYLGLRILKNLAPHYPKGVHSYKDVVLSSLSDRDSTIQQIALTLVVSMVTETSLPELVSVLLTHIAVAAAPFRDKLVEAVLDVCSRNRYELLQDFSQYLKVLADMARLPGCPHAQRIGDQLLDITVRVDEVRAEATEASLLIVQDSAAYSPQQVSAGSHLALKSAAWVVGENARLLEGSQKRSTIEALLRPEVASTLPGGCQAVFITAVQKIYAAAASVESEAEASSSSSSSSSSSLRLLIEAHLKPFISSSYGDVQCRANELSALLKLESEQKHAGGEGEGGVGVESKNIIGSSLASVYAEHLYPISAKAQGRVPVPPGLFDLLLLAKEDASRFSPSGGASVADSEEEKNGSNTSSPAERGANNASMMEDSTTSEAAMALTKQSKRQAARAQEEARERLQQHRERHGTFYLGEGGGGGGGEGNVSSSQTNEGLSSAQTGHMSSDSDTPPPPHTGMAIPEPLRKVSDTSVVAENNPTSSFLVGFTQTFERKASITIRDDEDLPELADGGGGGSGAGGDGGVHHHDPLNVDLNAPLQRGEGLPTLQQYPQAKEIGRGHNSAQWVGQGGAGGEGGGSKQRSRHRSRSHEDPEKRHRRRSSSSRHASRGEGGGEDGEEKRERRRRSSSKHRKGGEEEEEERKLRREHRRRRKEEKEAAAQAATSDVSQG